MNECTVRYNFITALVVLRGPGVEGHNLPGPVPSGLVSSNKHLLTHPRLLLSGGDAKLLVMLCCSPAQRFITETLQCLGFGSRARQVARGQAKKRRPTSFVPNSLSIGLWTVVMYKGQRTGRMKRVERGGRGGFRKGCSALESYWFLLGGGGSRGTLNFF